MASGTFAADLAKKPKTSNDMATNDVVLMQLISDLRTTAELFRSHLAETEVAIQEQQLHPEQRRNDGQRSQCNSGQSTRQ